MKFFTTSFLIIGMFLMSFGPQLALAASLTSVSDALSTVKINTLANHTINFITPTGVAAAGTITITFPAQFTMGTFNINNVDLAVSSGGTCTSFSDKTISTSASGATWGVGQSGQIITITSGTDTIAANRCISVEIGSNATSGATGTTQITNPSSAANYAIAVAGSFGDTGSATVTILTDDQVSVSATVDQTMTFAISDNSIGFGSLSSSSTRYANGATTGSGSETSAHDITASTNAATGYSVTVTGATLTSGLNTIDSIAGGPTALSTGTEQFGVRATATGGAGTVSATYTGSSGNYGYSTTPLVATTFATATGSSATTTYAAYYAANISATTEAGSYTTALTYVATANF